MNRKIKNWKFYSHFNEELDQVNRAIEIPSIEVISQCITSLFRKISGFKRNDAAVEHPLRLRKRSKSLINHLDNLKNNPTLRKLAEGGCLRTDTPGERLKKATLTIVVVPFSLAGLLLGWFNLAEGSFMSGAILFGYGILSLASLILFVLWKHYMLFQFSQIMLILLLPFLLQISLGGFNASGAVALWGILGPLTALVFYDKRTSLRWFIAFILLALITFGLNSTVVEYVNHDIHEESISIMLMVNILAVSSMAFLVLFIFVEKQSELRAIVKMHSKEISDSIRYASNIQTAILPSNKYARKLLPEHFVLYIPKDVVSGDFYWMDTRKGKAIFAAVDCTGHGVPGALVSVIGHNGLNQAVNEFGLTKPSEILDKLNSLVEDTFAKSENSIKDGMDIALCSLDLKNKSLEYAGAYNSLYSIKNGELLEIKGDKQPIGKFDNRHPFTNHKIDIGYGDCFFMASDGFADQFGGPKGKKFMNKRFKQLLLDNHNKPMNDLKRVLEKTIEKWKGDIEQVDDICVIGLRI